MFITIGIVKGSFGLKGEIKVSPDSDHPDRLSSLPQMNVFLLKNGVRQPHRVLRAGVHQAFWRVQLSAVESREQAEKLVGAELQIARNQVLPLPEGRYYIFDLLGLSVETVAGEHLGEIIEVLQPGANDVYVVRGPNQTELMVPAIKQVVKLIDLTARRMVVDPLPGLFGSEDEQSDAD